MTAILDERTEGVDCKEGKSCLPSVWGFERRGSVVMGGVLWLWVEVLDVLDGDVKDVGDFLRCHAGFKHFLRTFKQADLLACLHSFFETYLFSL